MPVDDAEYQRVVDEREQYRELYMKTLEQCRKLELGLLGQKSERMSDNEAQLSMSLLGELLDKRDREQFPVEKDKVREHERQRPTGRKPLPETLPRVEVEVLPPEVEAQGRDNFERIGQEVAETIERRPASLVVVRVVRGKFVRRDRERMAETKIHIAEPPEMPIERGLAGPGMLADTIVRRWQDHMPLHRQEQMYARDGLELARSTICGWHLELGDLVKPLVDAMWTDALTSPYLCTDATGVLVQAKEKCKNGHFWVLAAPDRYVLYGYSAKHDGKAVDKLLRDYKGYLVADAHAVYDHLYTGGDVIEVGCYAHCRRYFWKALDSDPDRAREALALLGELFRVERTIADAPTRKREVVRERMSRPVVTRFFAWCDEHAPVVLDGTPIAAAIGYARNQRVALSRFLEDARLPLTNNISERALRREVIGRKNWLFVGSDDAAEVNALFVSLLATCRLHHVEPWSYLRDLFCLLPSWPSRRVLELAPHNWNQTIQQPDAQQRLAANVFRRAVVEQAPIHTP